MDRFFESGGTNPVLEEIIDAVKIMSKNKVGALIVFAKNAAMSDVISPGVQLQADVTKDLLL
ncbi:diadenylate cyclase, partial [Arthrospira platensis SPKY1]|nr:diadenylate cyclase [Arthrospira platensis SPKY1]